MARDAGWRPRTLAYAATEKASPATLGLIPGQPVRARIVSRYLPRSWPSSRPRTIRRT
jgi:hypothetical protein